MGKRGYPILFASGETANGEPLIDRQHPHDFLMEMSARLDFDLGGTASAFLYGGLPGEPAIGPAAFMHRGSARFNPEAPVTHHWFDSTHLTFGVLTAGIGTDRRSEDHTTALKSLMPPSSAVFCLQKTN